MTEENQTSSTEQMVRIKKLGEKKEVELPLSEFLKVILSGLPNTDNVNDEIRLNNGDVYIPSSLVIATKDGKSNNESSSTVSF